MSQKIDLVYDMVTRIDERMQEKAVADAERHGLEHARLEMIEADLREHKEGVIQNRSRIESLEDSKEFKDKLVKKSRYLIGYLSGAIGLGLMIYKVLG